MIRTGYALAVLASVAAVGCGSSDAGSDAPTDPVAQMEVAFDGTPRQSEIKAQLDRAFKLYKMPATDENYSRAGSSLVALRKKTGESEMAILREAIYLHQPGVALKLPDAFGLAAAGLDAEQPQDPEAN
jgi:hypothetical protein